jgi:hypothetical protein
MLQHVEMSILNESSAFPTKGENLTFDIGKILGGLLMTTIKALA